MNEPFNRTPDQVAELTDYQIHELIFHPRDEKGRLSAPEIELPGEEDRLSLEEERQLLFGMGQALGVPEAALRAAWRQKHGER
jgi:hypothetical protein